MTRCGLRVLVFLLILGLMLIFYSYYFIYLELTYGKSDIYFMSNNALCVFRQFLNSDTSKLGNTNITKKISWLILFCDILFGAICISQLLDYLIKINNKVSGLTCKKNTTRLVPATMVCLFSIPLVCLVVSLGCNMANVQKEVDAYVNTTTTLKGCNLDQITSQSFQKVTFVYLHGLIVFSLFMIFDILMAFHFMRNLYRFLSST